MILAGRDQPQRRPVSNRVALKYTPGTPAVNGSSDPFFDAARQTHDAPLPVACPYPYAIAAE